MSVQNRQEKQGLQAQKLCLRRVSGDGVKHVHISKKKTLVETMAANYNKFPSIEVPKFFSKKDQGAM